MRERRLDQALVRLGRAKSGMRRERDVGERRQHVARRQRLDLEHVERGVAELARGAAPRPSPPRRPARRARCSPAGRRGASPRSASRERKPRVSSFSRRCIETASLSASSRSIARTRRPGWAFGVRFQASTFMPMPDRHPRDLGGDAAEADQAERLAAELRALGAQPLAVAHAAVHRREAARGGEQQADRALGDRGVAVALDDVDRDADPGERLRVHVAARAGAEEDDVGAGRRSGARSRSATRCGR